VRSMLRSKPAVFEDLRSALKYIKKFMRVPIMKWAERSFILKDSLLKKRIDDYVRRVDLL
ncbi:MAG: hypothetical protein ABIJ94_04555, partial [candidate division WOR-3 bacterium]